MFVWSIKLYGGFRCRGVQCKKIVLSDNGSDIVDFGANHTVFGIKIASAQFGRGNVLCFKALEDLQSVRSSLGANVVLVTAQIVIGISKSQGLIADGIHSSSDLIADFIVLL